MSNESSTTKLVFNANAGRSPSITPTSSSPVNINGGEQQHQQHQHINGNGMLHEGKLTSNNYQNGALHDLQTTFQGSSWSNVLDPLPGPSDDHPFDTHNGGRMFSSQTTTPPPLMAMQQQQQQQQQQMAYQQVV